MNLEVIARKPDGEVRRTPLVFVHGAWHGAWCWEHFQSYFAEQGYASYALSLRGHGASEGRDRLRWIRAAEYVADVEYVAGQLSQPPVLIGHSMGGYVIQKYLEKHSAAAAVLLASMPVRGSVKIFNRMLLRHPWQTIKMYLTMESFALIETPSLAREGFFSDGIPDEKLSRYFAQLQSESYRAGWDMCFFNIPRPERIHRVPMLVLGAGNDRWILTEEVETTASAYQTKAEIFSGMAHDMMLEADWIKVAGRINGWLREKGF